MPNLLSILPKNSVHASRFPRAWTIHLRAMLWGAMLIGVPAMSQAAIAQMSSPDTLPVDLRTAISDIDAAANAKDIDAVMQFYAPNFQHADGLTHSEFEQVLTQLWDRYPNLHYETEILGWEERDGGVVVETETTITGTPTIANRTFDYAATLTSEQRFEGQQIVAQNVLAEESQLTTGEAPPNVLVNLPDNVMIGRDFYFDAIVTDPLGDRRLLGAAIDEPTNIEGYLDEPAVNFELLSAGGLFKIGEAPTVPGSRWISGVLVHENGITITTQRLAITSPDMIDPTGL